MHILFLSDNFPPEVNAPASRTFEHCREWVRLGHRVTVITGVPNFPAGRVYPGYRNLPWQRATMDGMRVVRVWTYVTANEGFGRRTMDYLSFMVTATIAALFVRRVDVVVGTSPQFFTVCAAWVVSLLKRAPFVFELRDLWPESIRVVGAMKDSAWLRRLERLELFLYRRAAAVVAVTGAFRRNLVQRGIDAGKIAVVTNGVDLVRFSPRQKEPELVRRYGLEDCFVAGYIGTHGLAHALETVLEAAARTAATDPRLRFLFLGDGARKQALVAEARRRGLENVLFLDSVAKEAVVRHWALLDVSIIHLRRSPLFETVIPSKLFESMAMGVPVLLGVRGECAAIVRREQVGLVFEPEDADSLCAAIAMLREDVAGRERMRRRCLAAAARYDRTALAGQMASLLESVVRTGRIGHQAAGSLEAGHREDH